MFDVVQSFGCIHGLIRVICVQLLADYKVLCLLSRIRIMTSSRGWMYKQIENGLLLPSFVEGVETFITFATSQPRSMDGTKIKCPCTLSKCRNKAYLEPNIVRFHLVRNGFVQGYYKWIYQGESAHTVAEKH